VINRFQNTAIAGGPASETSTILRVLCAGGPSTGIVGGLSRPDSGKEMGRDGTLSLTVMPVNFWLMRFQIAVPPIPLNESSNWTRFGATGRSFAANLIVQHPDEEKTPAACRDPVHVLVGAK